MGPKENDRGGGCQKKAKFVYNVLLGQVQDDLGFKSLAYIAKGIGIFIQLKAKKEVKFSL